MEMIAAVVEPVGRKPYWSLNSTGYMGSARIGHKTCLVVIFSSILDMIKAGELMN